MTIFQVFLLVLSWVLATIDCVKFLYIKNNYDKSNEAETQELKKARREFIWILIVAVLYTASKIK